MTDIALSSDQNFSIDVKGINVVSAYSIFLRRRDIEESVARDESGILVGILRRMCSDQDLGIDVENIECYLQESHSQETSGGSGNLGMRRTLCCVEIISSALTLEVLERISTYGRVE